MCCKRSPNGAGRARYLVALGYAGWGEGQLETEMERHGWFMAPASQDLLFATPTARRWTAAFAASGIDTRLLTVHSGTA